ncbi:MAG: GDSL-type esterase/lipase family protein [Geminicoccaceae bacterium]
MRKLAGVTALLAISLVIALVLVEAGLRITGRVRNVGPSFSEFHPVYGKWLKRDATIHRQTPEFDMVLQTDSEGFRGPGLPADTKSTVIFTGDSFTMGYGVDQNEDFPSLVRAEFERRQGKNAVAVVNTGVGNSGNGRTLLWLEREAERFDPSLVVIQLTGNDFEDNREEGLFELGADGELRPLGVRQPGSSRLIQSWIDDIPGLADLHLVGFAREVVIALRQRRAPTQDAPPSADPGNDALTYALIERILALCNERGWPFVGLTVDIEGERFAHLDKLFEKAGGELLATPSKSERPDLYYVQDGHWRPEGHEAAAALLLEWIASHPLQASGDPKPGTPMN